MYKRLKKSAYAFDNKGTIHRVFVLTLACLVHGLCSNVGMATMRYLTIPKMSDGASKRIPNVTLLDQDGKKVRFYTDLVQDKTVIISFIFTTCTASCSSVGATFARMQSLLRDKPGRDIHLISITIDPETDTPFRLREWAAQFGAAPGWTLLTGSQRDIDDLTKSLTGSVKRKGLHTPEVIIGSDARDVWVHTYALDKPSNILEEAETAGFRQQALVGSFPDDFSTGPVGSPGNKARRIAAVALPDGRADVFMVGIDGHLWHSVQTSPNGNFPDFAGAPVGSSANVATDIAAVRMADGHIEVFMVGTDGRMWRSPQQPNGSFPDFAQRPVGSPANKAQRIAVVALPDGRADVFMVGLDQHMWHSVQSSPNGSFPDFANAPVGSPANLATDIAAARMPDGHIEVFMVGIDGHMWRSPQQSNGSFPDFADRPFGYSRNLAIRIVVVPFSDGRRDVYMVRQDQTMWRNFETTDYGWRELTGIGRTTNNDTGWYMYYPWAYVAPNGKVFIAGPTKKTFWIDAQGNGSLAPGPASSVFRDYGSSVMYDVGKILILGGGTTGQNQAYGSAQTIDLNGSGVWVDAGSMNHPRKHANATILPNGQVLVVGGTTLGGDPSRDYEQFNRFVLDAEVWDPTTNRWSLMAGMRIPRTYHSTAVLLPSGRVLVAGGGQGGGLDAHPSAEIYSPNYLFRGPRPVIASAPASVRYNRSFDVVTAEAQAITGVTLVSLGSTTHAYNQSQRFNRLHFTRNAGKVTATAPSGGNICPPGYYMLFILNGDGIPSEAKIVRVSN